MVAAFLGSGAYMHLRLHHLHQTPDAQRMVYRASHINLLLIGALNIAASRRARSASRFDHVAAMLEIAASGFFVAAFICEPLYAHLYRPWTRAAVTARLRRRSLKSSPPGPRVLSTDRRQNEGIRCGAPRLSLGKA